jgi:hypothetical protein
MQILRWCVRCRERDRFVEIGPRCEASRRGELRAYASPLQFSTPARSDETLGLSTMLNLVYCYSNSASVGNRLLHTHLFFRDRSAHSPRARPRAANSLRIRAGVALAGSAESHQMTLARGRACCARHCWRNPSRVFHRDCQYRSNNSVIANLGVYSPSTGTEPLCLPCTWAKAPANEWQWRRELASL